MNAILTSGGGSFNPASPGDIGTTTPARGLFTTDSGGGAGLQVTGQGLAGGSAPIFKVVNYQGATAFSIDESLDFAINANSFQLPSLQLTGSGGILHSSYAAFPIINPTLQWPSNAPDVQLDSVASGVLQITANGSGAAVLKLGIYTVATLPSSATVGSGCTAFVTDATAPAFGVAAVGSGSVKVPVYADGSTWLVG